MGRCFSSESRRILLCQETNCGEEIASHVRCRPLAKYDLGRIGSDDPVLVRSQLDSQAAAQATLTFPTQIQAFAIGGSVRVLFQNLPALQSLKYIYLPIGQGEKLLALSDLVATALIKEKPTLDIL